MIDRAGLGAFCHQSEGELPPVFVGRTEVLTALRHRGSATRTLQHMPGHTRPAAVLRGIPKATQLIQGAPGAGKSSVLAKLQEECTAQQDEGAPRVVIVSSQSVIGSLPQVLKLIRAAGECSPSTWKDILSHIGVNISANSLGEISAAVGWNMDGLDTPRTLDHLAEIAPSQNWRAPVIVAVDEAQRISGGDATPHAHFLQSIHDASSGLPLTLVLAGLSDTKSRTHAIGLTRGVTIHNLYCLDTTECHELVGAFCRKFGIDTTGYESELQALAEPTEGWPRHLHFTLQALAKEFLRVQGSVADVQWQYITDNAAQSRVAYYQHQQSEIFIALKALIGAVMEDHQEGDDRAVVIDRIDRYLTKQMCKSLPLDQQTIEFAHVPAHLFEEMLHQGALQEYAPDKFHSPIPSFRRHLIKEGMLASTNPLPPRGAFKLMYGNILSAEQDGFGSIAEARDWAHEKIEQIKTGEDISLWYKGIKLETLREATPAPSDPPNDETVSLHE